MRPPLPAAALALMLGAGLRLDAQGPAFHAFVAPDDPGRGAVYWFKTDRGNVLVGAPFLPEYAEALKRELAHDGAGELGAIVLLGGRPEETWGLARLLGPATRVWASKSTALRLARDFAARREDFLRLGFAQDRLPAAPPVATNTFEASLNLGFEGFTLRLFEMSEAEPNAPTIALIPETGDLFAGDVVWVKTHPALFGIDLRVWRRVLTKLKGFRARRIHPGHGPDAGPEAIDALAAYLAFVEETVQPYIVEGKRALTSREVMSIKRLVVRRFPGWELPAALDRSIPREFERQKRLLAEARQP